MFAVLKTGGKQYRVSPHLTIAVEKLEGNAGDLVEFSDVLMVSTPEGVRVGAPLLIGTKVTAELIQQARAEKVIIFKKKRRHNYRRKNGHRQALSLVKIKDIVVA